MACGGESNPATPATTVPPEPESTERANSNTATPTPQPAPTYTVVAGDTLRAIADRFGTSVEEIVALNRIANINRIEVGQVLVLPRDPDSPTMPTGETFVGPPASEVDAFEFARDRIAEVRQAPYYEAYEVERANHRFVQIQLIDDFRGDRWVIVERTLQPEYDGYQFRWGGSEPPPSSTDVYFSDPDSVPFPPLLTAGELPTAPPLQRDGPPGVSFPSRFVLIAAQDQARPVDGGTLHETQYLYQDRSVQASVECQISAGMACGSYGTWDAQAVGDSFELSSWATGPADWSSGYDVYRILDPAGRVAFQRENAVLHFLVADARLASVLSECPSSNCFALTYSEVVVASAADAEVVRRFAQAAGAGSESQRSRESEALAREYGQGIVTTVLRYVPVYDGQSGSFTTFDTWARGQSTGSDTPFDRDPVGSTVDLIFDPSPSNISRLLGWD